MTPDTVHFFRVRACDAQEQSEWSEIASAQTEPIPAGSFTINDDAAYTNTTTVTLNSDLPEAVEMRFKNDDDEWHDFDAAHSWTLPEGDGLAVVESQFRDAAGNVSPTESDDIVLDTAGPVVNAFTIAGPSSDSETYTSNVDLQLDVTDAVSMRFSNVEGTDWSSSQPYDSTVPWTIREEENFVVDVYAEFADEAGNVSESRSHIYYDAVRRLSITARSIEVLYDGDPTSPGEICWNFWAVFDAPSGARLSRTISQRESSQAVALSDGQELRIGDSRTIEIAREPGSWINADSARSACRTAPATAAPSSRSGVPAVFRLS